MNGRNRRQCARQIASLAKTGRLPLVAAAMALAVGAGGCSHGSGTDAAETPFLPPPPPPPPPPPVGGLVLTVTAQDAFGAPVPGAEIAVFDNSSRHYTLVADAQGRAELSVGNSPPPVFSIRATTADLAGWSAIPASATDDRADFLVVMHPSADLAGGVTRLSVTSPPNLDGRSLEFTIRLLVVEHYATETFEDWNYGHVSVLSCTADAGNDTPRFQADCVEGPAGFDAGYAGTVVTTSFISPAPDPAPLAMSLVLDQGESVIVNDPADRRLFGAKYLQTQLAESDQVAVAAFAADDAVSGQAALLTKQPLTIYPIDDPGFTSDGGSYFPAIDSLAALEGGASPLHAALSESIDFTAAAAPSGTRPAVVVLSSGNDPSCGTREACHAAQRALLEQTASAAVRIVAVGLAKQFGRIDPKVLGTLAQSENGTVFWAKDPRQVATIFGRLPEILDGGHAAAGTAQVAVCPWDCEWVLEIPFALRIP